MKSPVCVVLGIGPGNGSAIAKRWAEAGHRVALLSRNAESLADWERRIPQSRAFRCDAREPESVRSAFARVRESLGPIDTLVHNAGAGIWGSLDEIDEADLKAAFDVNAVGLFVAAKEAVADMRAAGTGTIAVIGAGAAWRGRPKTLAFAAAKAAQRSLAQSLARELGPHGIHVFYVVIDGVIDLPRTRERMKDKPQEFFLRPDAIAESVWNVAHQPRSAWTFELDLRPFAETW